MRAAPPDSIHTAPPVRTGSVIQAWRSLRDRLLTSAAFQRWAASFPLTRPIARRRAQALFDLCSGFVYSQVLWTCVRLRVFQHLAEGPRDVRDLARALSLPEESTWRLLRAAASLGLVETRESSDRFGLGIHGATLLGNPGLLPMIEHHSMFYADLQDPIALLRGSHPPTRLERFWSYARTSAPKVLSDEATRDYTALMSSSQHLIAWNVLHAYSFKRHAHLLDLGGGDGTFAAQVAINTPKTRVTLFDLPAVATRARERFRLLGLGERLLAEEGDFCVDPLPAGADVISLVRVLHDHDDASVRRILAAASRALPAKGTLIIAEPMSGTGSAGAIADAYFGFYLLAMGSGRARSLPELSALLEQAGFARPKLLPTPLPAFVRVLVTRKLTTASVTKN